MSKRKKVMSFHLSIDTAIALQSVLTQQSVHIKKHLSEPLDREFQQINRFYISLTEFVENNA